MDFGVYKQEVMVNALRWMRENDNYLNYNTFDECFEAMLDEDSITGNNSGSYTFNADQAEINVRDLVFDTDFRDAMAELGFYSLDEIFDTPEGADVRARCAALREVCYTLEKMWRVAKKTI